MGCNHLPSINIPNSLTSIADYAFAFCAALTSVTLPASLTSIGEGAFRQCGALSSVTLQSSMPPTLGTEAFFRLPGTCKFSCPPAALNAYLQAPAWYPYFVTYPFKFSVAGNAASVTGPSDGLTLNSLDIPSSVYYGGIPVPITAIGANAFNGHTSLASLILPSSFVVIGDYAFAGCTSLTTVTLQSGTPPAFGTNAFAGVPGTCKFSCPSTALPAYLLSPAWYPYFVPYPFTFTVAGGAASVTGPSDGVTLNSLDIPLSVYYGGIPVPITAIAANAFNGHTSLASLTLPASLTSIGASAFANCAALSSVTLQSATPPALGNNAFAGVPPACAFDCPAPALDTYRNNPQWNTFFPIPYPFTFSLEADGNITVLAPVAPKATVTQMVIPQEILYGGVYRSITAIGAYAFAGCTALTSVTLQSGTPPAFGAGAFAGVPETCKFSCPSTALNAYLQAPAWYPYFVTYPFKFTVAGGATVTGPADGVTLTTLTIPASVYYGGVPVPVTAIGASAFSGCTSLSSVTLQSPTQIGRASCRERV
jgi:hypothetical protein